MPLSPSTKRLVGKVAATEKQPSTIDEFYFWTREDFILNPFDVVVVRHVNDSLTYGVVEEISHVTDSGSFLADFISNDFGDLDNAPTNTLRIGMNYAKARVVGNTKDVYIPVRNGSPVSLGTAEEVCDALGLRQNEQNGVVCGCLEMYGSSDANRVELPVYLNPDFLVGPEGAHLNISGISGLASKTSYAMFLLNALQQASLQERLEQSVAYIVLNVKGRDLLTLDRPAPDLPDDARNVYKTLGLDLKPFQQVKYFYPNGGERNPWIGTYGRPEVVREQVEAGQAFRYQYVFNEDKENLELLFSNVDDPQSTIESIVHFILNEEGPFEAEKANKVDNWEALLKKVDEMCASGRKDHKEISVMSWRKFKRILHKSIEKNPLFTRYIESSKQEIRLEDAIKKIQKDDVYVVDVAKQDENMQAFVFGSVMQAAQKLKLGGFDEELSEEARKSIPDRIVIFVDELNKYASSDSPKNSAILRLLLDIAERGRSLGIVLFSAEQFKSAIHKRVVGNCSTHAYGRTNAIEIADKAYSFVPATFKNMMTRLKQGEYIVQNPIFNSMLKIKFPRPLYEQDKGATK
ncbi:MAG: ATP-binding protein [Thermoguttaceae bacterium]|nr:ATP-binding protein [Thermoguttaceae bacterium]